MSRCAHAQSDYKLRELPKCSRCKQQFVLVLSRYEIKEGVYNTIEEWECTKCNKTVPKEFLKEQEPSADEKFFHQRSVEIENERRREKEQARKQTMRNDFKNRNTK